MLTFYDQVDIAPFVLHEICSDACFGFSYAAYFIDNPDFDCCKGIAGIVREDVHTNIWDTSADFMSYIQRASFNKRVRELEYTSAQQIGYDALLTDIQHDLELPHPTYCHHQIKNGNHAILVYSPSSALSDDERASIKRAVSLLGFCPIT